VRIDQRERLLRKELRKLLPVDKDDVAAIEAITAHGYPAVQPILLDLLKWIRDESWPVAKPACEFLVTIGPQLARRCERSSVRVMTRGRLSFCDRLSANGRATTFAACRTSCF
jgi:Domain of unknown function (DUF5071)